MARIRTIKPEFPHSESMGRVSRDARLCFIMLWTLADDLGRLRGNSRMLASLLFPYDDDAPKQIGKWLDQLESEGCIVRYHIENDSYIEIRNWLIHQKVDKPSPSKLPAFDESSRGFATNSRDVVVGSGPGPGPITPLDHRKEPDDRGVGEFAKFWAAYPRKVGKGAAEKAWAKAKINGHLPDVLAALEKQKQSDQWTKDGGQFIPHPSTWLSQKRWEDEVPAGETSSLARDWV